MLSPESSSASPDGDARLGRVARADRTTCEILLPTPDGAVATTASWGPALTRAARIDPTAGPATGDWVLVRPGSEASRPTITEVLPRRTAIVRAQVTPGSSHGQVLAANADVVAVVEGMAPSLSRARIERLLALAWSSGAVPLVVLTKADLVPDPAALVAQVALVAPGAEVLATSSTRGLGLERLRELLAAGSTIALLGASGVGKSTLLNALLDLPDDGVMRTQPLRSDGKGRHTTVTRELHLVPGGGAVLDTPGLRSVGLVDIGSLDTVFPDIEDLATSCRFADCAHAAEPGCAIRAAVESGELDPRRLASYRSLLREAEFQASRTDARLRAARAGRLKTLARAQRQAENRR